MIRVLRNESDMKKTGFTLIEMMIVISALILLSALAFPNFTITKKNTALYSQGKLIWSDVSYMKQLANDRNTNFRMIFNSDGTGYYIKYDPYSDYVKSVTFESNITFDSSGSSGLSTDSDGLYYFEISYSGTVSTEAKIKLKINSNLYIYITVGTGGIATLSWS